MPRIALTVSSLLLVSLVCGGDAADPPSDPVAEALADAKRAYSNAVDEARSRLLNAIDAAIRAQAQAGDLDSVVTLQTEKEVFIASGALPAFRGLAGAVTEYKTALEKARRNLQTAHETAIKEYTKALKIEQAREVQKQLRALPEGAGRDVKVKKAAFVYTFYEWKSGQPPVKMLHKDEGFCYLVGVTGAFNGLGEAAEITLEKDGFWYLSGRTLAVGGLNLRAVGVRLVAD